MIGGNMNKKQIYIILGTIILFVIIILGILLIKSKNNWQEEILSSDEYTMTMEDCNNRKTEFPKEKTEELFIKWNNLTDNGPWTGDEKACYKTVTIIYEKESIVQSVKILLIDNSSLVLNINNIKRYYINSEEINAYLNNLFETY